MSDYSPDPKQIIADAIARGISAEDQFARFNTACLRCAKRPEKGIFTPVDVSINCMNTCDIAQIISDNMAKIDAAIFPDGENHSPTRPDQDWSDECYHREYWEYARSTPDEVLKVLNHLYDGPLSPDTRAKTDALFDLYKGLPYYPPIIDSDAPPTPARRRRRKGQPDLDDTEMSALSLSERRQAASSRYPRGLVDALMPVADYWIAETATTPTLHVVGECPAYRGEASDMQELDEAIHPMHLADELGAHLCGTCIRLLQVNEKDGFLFGNVTAWRSLVIWSDRVEYETPGILGIGRTQLTAAAREIESVAFPTLKKLVLKTVHGAEVKVSFDRDAEGDVAREAFRRHGWSFAD